MVVVLVGGVIKLASAERKGKGGGGRSRRSY